MFVTDHLAHCTTRVACTFPGGAEGTGTAFVMNLCVEGSNAIPVLVTNRHVVKGAVTGRFWFTLRKPNANEPDYGKHHNFELDNFSQRWLYHKTLDLAVMPLQPFIQQGQNLGYSYFFSPLTPDLLPSPEELADLPALLDIVLVGYPNGIWDEKNNQPIIRKGITATHPELDYNGRPEFVIDAACFNGSSGSPVFLLELGRTVSRASGMTIGNSRVKLLGILYAGPMHFATGEVRAVEIGQKTIAVTGVPNNLGYVISSRAVKDFEPVLNFLNKNGRLPARNEACPCASTKRYKECCGVTS
ncbi:trypsin-like peptidase domain-containing protein [Rubrivivax benzoatilyticus]|uniref:Serine protease n=1 Tax=Rubrivivax benzoatilyticus TaxID=316997 RepID=A0ABX0HST2_9BURK|nr:trypsin-like peptidase domain-containing protein [Rubrivivax benzoatilyticus]EGJ10834.1 hypothetical protein RBXJA2T_10931 [Rubrivivax benzoatilyticus JA2 = ATCC BAA-35]NHK98107.1 hypothetical protein [Rubrivivax benzoatilyticus]NHL23609.1 hypothetical protein [Rubrivivax benzoatilyticus]